jgi:TatD DNase family protein
MLIDCHAHLASEAFDADRDAVLARARAAGVERVLVVAEGPDDAEAVLAVCAGSEVLRPCLGVHPDQASHASADAVLALIEAHAGDLAAIGEVGLDYRVTEDEAVRAVQREVLARFVAASLRYDLALNVHSRSAGHYTIDLLREAGARRVLLHAFDGKAHYAEAAAEAGFRFSVPPSIVRSPQKQKLVARLPLDALLLETDSPVLGPEPRVRNEPANAALSARAIADIKGLPMEAVIEATTANARALFGAHRL